MRIDSLEITKGPEGTVVFSDEFDGTGGWTNGDAATYYGWGTESDGDLVLDSDDGFITSSGSVVQYHVLFSNTDDAVDSGFQLDARTVML